MTFDPMMILAAVFVIAQMIQAGANVTSMKRNTARVPPLDQEIYKDFATKAEVARLEGKMDALISSNGEALRDMTKSISELSGMIREHLRQDGVRHLT